MPARGPDPHDPHHRHAAVIVTREIEELTPAPGGAVVSIGVFDGVHRGHQAILARNVATARELAARSTVVTFRRHPKRLLLGRGPRTLTTLDHRLELFRRAGIEHAVALTFDESLRDMEAEEFAQRICVEGLGVRRFVLGFDSKFGRGRRGGAQLLRSSGFEVEVVPKVVVDGRAVSSTAIRESVELGDLASAERMLGREVAVFGRVVHGQNLGHELGFPTANLDLAHELHPPPGVWATRARLPGRFGERILPGVTNIGFRPTVSEEPPELPEVEVHLFDLDEDLYGEWMELSFVARIRGEKRFDGLESLTAQIRRDVEMARAILARPPKSH